MRPHRSLRKFIGRVNPAKSANKAEEYLEDLKTFPASLKRLPGLVKTERIRKSIQKIDRLEREMIKLEDKLEKLSERRALEALKLEENIGKNDQILSPYLKQK